MFDASWRLNLHRKRGWMWDRWTPQKEIIKKSNVADPRNFGTDPDPRTIYLTNGSGCGSGSYVSDFLKVYLHHFSKIKVIKKSQYSRNQCFSYYFCLLMEGSGSISLTNGSGFGSARPKNIWISCSDPDPQHWRKDYISPPCADHPWGTWQGCWGRPQLRWKGFQRSPRVDL
jgi:hypothetical protein